MKRKRKKKNEMKGETNSYTRKSQPRRMPSARRFDIYSIERRVSKAEAWLEFPFLCSSAFRAFCIAERARSPTRRETQLFAHPLRASSI